MKIHSFALFVVLQAAFFETITGDGWSLNNPLKSLGRIFHREKKSSADKKGVGKEKGPHSRALKSSLTAQSEPLSLVEAVGHLNTLAPLHLKEPWDNVGLLVEPQSPRPIKTIFLTNDLTMPVLAEALNESADMIIAYHPPIFKSLNKITTGTWKEQIVGICIEKGLAVYSPHTCWDVMTGGTADWLASAFNPKKVEPIASPRTTTPEDKKRRFLVEVHGVKNLGCSTHSKTLLELGGNDADVKCNTKEKRVSIFTTEEQLPSTLDKISKNFANHNPTIKNVDPIRDSDLGVGRLVTLVKPTPIKVLVEQVKEHLGVPHLQLALSFNHHIDHPVSRIAVVPGSGGSVLLNLASGSADVYLTGEMSHHELIDANHQNVSVLMAHHSNTERGFLKEVATKLMTDFSRWPSTSVILSKQDRDPLVVV